MQSVSLILCTRGEKCALCVSKLQVFRVLCTSETVQAKESLIETMPYRMAQPWVNSLRS